MKLESIINRRDFAKTLGTGLFSAYLAIAGALYGAMPAQAQNAAPASPPKISQAYSGSQAQASEPAKPALTFSHYARGGNYSLEIMLTNPSDKEENGFINFKDDFGNLQENVPYSIAPRGAYKLKLDSSGSLRTGYAEVISNIPNSKITGNIVFNYFGNEVTVPSNELNRESHIFVEKHKGVNSGYAILNNSSMPLDATLLLLDNNGVEYGRESLRLEAGQKIAEFADQRFPQLNGIQNFEGSLQVMSENGVKYRTFGLRLNNETYSSLSGSPTAVDPKRVRAEMYAVDVVDFKQLQGPTTFQLGDKIGVSDDGMMSFFVEAGKKYSANITNSKILDPWRIIRYSLNGPNIEQVDAANGYSPAAVPVTIDSSNKQIYVIGIPNESIGMKSYFGDDKITLEHFLWQIQVPGRENQGLRQWLDPRNIKLVITNELGKDVSYAYVEIAKAVDYINYSSKTGKVRITIENRLPTKTDMDLRINNKGYNHGDDLKGNVIAGTSIDFSDGTTINSLFAVALEEIWESIANIDNIPLNPPRPSLYYIVKPADSPNTDNVIFSEYGRMFNAVIQEFNRGTKFRPVSTQSSNR